MKQHARKKSVPTQKKDDKIPQKESTWSALLGSVIRVLEMLIAGGVLAIFFPGANGILTSYEFAKAIAWTMAVCLALVAWRNRV